MLEQVKINWGNDTVEIHFEIWLDTTAGVNLVRNLVLTWRNAKIDDMVVDNLANNLLWTFQGSNGGYYTMAVGAELLNEDEQCLAIAKSTAGVLLWRPNLKYVIFGAGYGGNMTSWYLEYKNADAVKISGKLIIKFTSFEAVILIV